MTLNDMLQDCYARLNYPTDPAQADPKVTARLTHFLNQTQQEIFGQPTHSRLLHLETTITTVPGQWTYGLPGYVARVTAVIDRQNQQRLGFMSVDAFRRYLPNPRVQQGTPTAYAFDGWGSVQQQPSDYGLDKAFLVTSPLNAGNVMHFSGITASGLFATNVTYTLLAAPPFQIIASNTVQIFDVYFEQPLVQEQSLIADDTNPATTSLAAWSQGALRGRFPQIYLANTPSGARLYDVFFERGIPMFTDPTSEPLIPPQFHYILPAGARMKEYEVRGDVTRFRLAQREYQDALGFLNAFISDMPDASDQMVPDDYRRRTSVLGPWFPASPYRGW